MLFADLIGHWEKRSRTALEHIGVQSSQFGWAPRTVTVPRDRYGNVNVDVDTGIR